MRIAHLTTVDMSLALLLRTELQVDVEAGHEVFGLSAPGPYVPEVEALGVTHVPLPGLMRSWDLRRDLTALRELVAAIRSLDLDVLHTHNPKTGVMGRVLGRAVGVPVVVNTVHGLWVRPEDRLAKKALVLGAEALAAQFSHAELYQNAEDRRTLSGVVPAWRSAVVGNGVDLSRFGPDPAVRTRVREELGAGDSELLVGGVGRRVAEKGIREFVAAARSLHGQARFIWVGPDDPDKPDALAEDEAGVEFLGVRHDMPDLYRALDVFVLPSYREGFSRSGMEAAASGLPLVLTDIRGCREVARHEQEALLVPSRDAAALTAAVARILWDQSLRERLGRAARDRALAEFDQRSVAAMSLATYEAVLAARGTRGR